MKKVVLTGASGFLGQHTLRALQDRDFHILAVTSRAVTQANTDQVTWRQVDLQDRAAARTLFTEERPSHLMHLAWRAVVGDIWMSAENLKWVEAGIALAEAFAEAGGARMVVCGSCAEYAWDTGVCVEDQTPLRPTTVYGAAKTALNAALKGLAMARELQLAWARPFFVYGEGESPQRLGAAVINALLAGEPVDTSHGRQIRDYLHAADVADGLAALADSAVVGDFNLASGETMRVSDLIFEIARQIGREDLVNLGARPAPAYEPPIILGDVRKSEAAFGWRHAISLSEGVARAIEKTRALEPSGS